jgi:hypothetical protein
MSPPADEFREVKTISPKVTVIMYNGRKYILKNQVYPHDDLLFHREIEVYITHHFASRTWSNSSVIPDVKSLQC